jgi:ABC-type transport system involved in cytochrome c biogenesis permease subunit
MPEAITASGAPSHTVSSALLVAALALYGASLLVTLSRPGIGVWLLRSAAAVHLLATIGRGLAIGFFPLTNKLESFSAASLAIALVTVATWRNVRLYAPLELTYPPPLMRTLWYPLHVPLSFLSYGVWAAAGAAGLVWFRTGESSWLARVDDLALKGFALWSLSMICGGFWGVAAWGSYFMWDVKIIWSVILWFHYASFVHLRLAPSLGERPWVRPALAVLGFVWVGVAYVGTSFFFGKSSHAF